MRCCTAPLLAPRCRTVARCMAVRPRSHAMLAGGTLTGHPCTPSQPPRTAACRWPFTPRTTRPHPPPPHACMHGCACARALWSRPAAYSRKKAEMLAERERREAEKQVKKEADRKRIADNIERAYLAFTNKEEERVAKEVAALEEKSAADEAARRQYIKDTQAALDRSRQAQLRAKVGAGRWGGGVVGLHRRLHGWPFRMCAPLQPARM